MTSTPDSDSTRERILAAAEALLRRHGPNKVAVVDVARACGMSHSNVYRHFPTKAALFDAIVARWLGAAETALAAIAARPGPAAARLTAVLTELHGIKRRKVTDDREIFETYSQLAANARAVVDRHLARLREIQTGIVADGIAAGEFAIEDPEHAVDAIEAATWRFRHPRAVLEHVDEPSERQLADVLALLIAGLRGGVV